MKLTVPSDWSVADRLIGRCENKALSGPTLEVETQG